MYLQSAWALAEFFKLMILIYFIYVGYKFFCDVAMQHFFVYGQNHFNSLMFLV